MLTIFAVMIHMCGVVYEMPVEPLSEPDSVRDWETAEYIMSGYLVVLLYFAFVAYKFTRMKERYGPKKRINGLSLLIKDTDDTLNPN